MCEREREGKREKESVCVCCLQGQGEVGGSVRMSGGICVCVCVCEGNHHSSHQRAALPPSLPSLLSFALMWRLFGGRVVTRGSHSEEEGESGEAGFDSVPGDLPEQQHQSQNQFLPLLHLSPFSLSSISRAGHFLQKSAL